jgi:thiopurine S-methyltransferase
MDQDHRGRDEHRLAHIGVALDYAPSVGGSPFSVPEAEIRSLYEPQLDVRLLERRDVLDDEPRFRARGMTELRESVYALRRR